jgi:hypothetical protein
VLLRMPEHVYETAEACTRWSRGVHVMMDAMVARCEGGGHHFLNVIHCHVTVLSLIPSCSRLISLLFVDIIPSDAFIAA